MSAAEHTGAVRRVGRGRSLAATMTVAALLLTPGSVQVVSVVLQHRAGTRQGASPTLGHLATLPLTAFRAADSAHGWPRRLWSVATELQKAARALETELEDTSPLAAALRPRVQRALVRLGAGNARVVVGRGSFLFFRPAIDHLTGPAFLAETTLSRRRQRGGAASEPDPRPAILQFRQQLADRGIALVLLPVPVKAGIEPAELSRRFVGSPAVVDNPSTAELEAELKGAGVLVFDPTPVLVDARAHGGAYLSTDTHWRPEAMAAVARGLAAFVKEHVELPEKSDPGFTTEKLKVTNRGDLAAMLELPSSAARFGAQTVEIEQVIGEGDVLWRLDPTADVLLLGDSFSNVFSLGAMGWGEAGGLAEHLSMALGRPIDTITRNDSAAWATRSLLAQELSRGRDRLAGKKVVVWELAARELSSGDWKRIPLTVGAAERNGFFVPDPGASVVATGTVTAIGLMPRPRSAPYADYIVALHLEDLSGGVAKLPGSEAVVFVLAMKNYELTPAAAYRVGQRLTFRLRRWSDVAAQYDLINRGELFEGGLMMQEPCWGEEVSQ
jgi:hypothetical protein